jgi:DNA-binding NarL/FixJ family response regulator
LLTRGAATNRQIAAELFITEGTANLHVKRILSKLGFASRAQVVAWASRNVRSVEGRVPAPAGAAAHA